MDLSGIRPTAINVEIKHPGTGEKTGLAMAIISPQDAQAGQARRKLQDAARKKGVTEPDTIEFLSSLVTGWEWGGDSMWGGEKLKFTPSNVRMVVAEAWVREQLDEALGDYSAFFQT